ncbi:MAG: hypothetical protein B7Z59_03260 [Acidiphilium sp. 37-67-22]|nr:MAG: hypothetical protein B7Z59_03260 [Acidiphilium sp. 37-67-22]HQT74906.1 hypothetical protein [Acidiphilium sp.]
MPISSSTNVSDADIEALIHEINAEGIGVLRGFAPPETLAPLKAFVEQKVADNHGEYVALTLTGAPPTPFAPVLQSPEFLDLMRRIYKKVTGKEPRKQSLYNVLRCVKGETGGSQSYFFHYDSYYITALLPVIIPQGEKAGHLIIRKRRRGVRSSYLQNLVDKIFLDNKFRQRLLRRGAKAGSSAFKEVVLNPGDLYFFWGYRTVHANADCDPTQLRATALAHFCDPHMSSGLRKFTGRAKQRAVAVDA